MQQLPQQLEKQVKGYTWHQITIGRSGANTFLLNKVDHSLYLKIQPINATESLQNEKEKMTWLDGKIAVPKVIYYGQEEEKEYLLMTAIEGINASDSVHKTNLPQLIRLLANGLKDMHHVNIKHCPFKQTLNVTIKAARKRVEENLIDLDDLDEIRKGKQAEELFRELLDKQPLEEDLVFTHGDYCLPNIILHQNKVSGFIDLGRAGIADRYQDIALAVRSIAYNFGKQYTPLFLKEYGLSDVDHDKIHYYQLLDEFF